MTETSTEQAALTCGCGVAPDGAPGSSQGCSAGCMVPAPAETGEVGEEHAKLLKALADLAQANHLMAKLVAAVTDYYVSPEPGVSEGELRRRLSLPHQNCERWLYSQDVPVLDWHWRKAQQGKLAQQSGYLDLAAVYDPETGQQVGVRVDRADLAVSIGVDLTAGPLAPGVTFDGTTLRIEATNGTWTYLVHEGGLATLIEEPAVTP